MKITIEVSVDGSKLYRPFSFETQDDIDYTALHDAVDSMIDTITNKDNWEV